MGLLTFDRTPCQTREAVKGEAAARIEAAVGGEEEHHAEVDEVGRADELQCEEQRLACREDRAHAERSERGVHEDPMMTPIAE